jgi:hypothetical protein
VSRLDVINLNEVKIHPATHVLLDRIMMQPVVRNALDEGGWIAGGFIRQVLLGNDITDYFDPNSQGRTGDIDIFFDDVTKAKRCVDEVNSHNASWGGFAKDVSVGIPSMGHITVQLVDSPDLCLPFEESLARFDFTNCKVALRDNKFYIPKGWKEIEAQKHLQVVSNASPFLGTRIIKYMKSRGLKNLTADSMPILSDWIYKVAAGDFPNFTSTHLMGLESAIRRLYDMNKVDPTYLALFMGRWTELTQVPKNYGHYETISVDWARNEISKLDEKRPVL